MKCHHYMNKKILGEVPISRVIDMVLVAHWNYIIGGLLRPKLSKTDEFHVVATNQNLWTLLGQTFIWHDYRPSFGWWRAGLPSCWIWWWGHVCDMYRPVKIHKTYAAYYLCLSVRVNALIWLMSFRTCSVEEMQSMMDFGPSLDSFEPSISNLWCPRLPQMPHASCFCAL